MTLKKWVLLAMALILFLSGLTGCKQNDELDRGSSSQGYIEPQVNTPTKNPMVSTDQPTTPSGDKTITLPDKEEEEVITTPEPEEEEQEEEPVPEEQETPEVVVEEGNTLKIVDYNIRCADDGAGKLIEERAARFTILMDQLDPDIMGLQEVTPRWLTCLQNDFSDDYEYVHRWRAASSQEGTPIFWKKDKFKLLDSGYFWLSETPTRESKAIEWGSEHYRICMWVKLRVKATGKDFLFFNTHFDFKETCHVNSAKVILTEAVKQKAFSKYAIFCTGDYNMGSNGKGHEAMCEKFNNFNHDLNNDKSITTNGYNESNGGSIIDFVFYSPKLVKPIKYQVLNEKINDGYISDHRGIYVEAGLI